MLIDSDAWMEYFMGTKKGERVKEIIEDNTRILYTLPIIIAEIYSKSLNIDDNVEDRKEFIIDRCVIIPIDVEIAVEAARIYARVKKREKGFGLMDAIVLASAKKKDVKVLTGDYHLRSFPECVML